MRLICAVMAGLIFSTSTMASKLPSMEAVQLTNCLASKINFDHQVLARNKQFQVIKMKASQVDTLVKIADSANCGRFKNVTKTVKQGVSFDSKKAMSLLMQPKPRMSLTANQYRIEHKDVIEPLLTQIEPNNIWQTLTSLTEFYNRSATSSTGKETAYWLQQQFNKMAEKSGRSDTATWFVDTGYYQQPSLVTVIGKDLKTPGVVVGAHMDTLSGRMPGAGDDGSGSSSVMEAARVILNSHQPLKRPIYIIWYAAEERGLVGSSYVVEHFQNKRVPVYAAIQFDMTGFRNNASDPTMWLFKDFTDAALTSFNADLIKQYVDVPVKYSRCGYGCSDHASWNEVGVPAAFPCETSYEDHNPVIHSSYDTMDRLNLNHMTNFSKLAVAFAMELALA